MSLSDLTAGLTSSHANDGTPPASSLCWSKRLEALVPCVPPAASPPPPTGPVPGRTIAQGPMDLPRPSSRSLEQSTRYMHAASEQLRKFGFGLLIGFFVVGALAAGARLYDSGSASVAEPTGGVENNAGDATVNIPLEALTHHPAGTTAANPVEHPVETPAANPVEHPVETPAANPVEHPVETPAQTPADPPTAETPAAGNTPTQQRHDSDDLPDSY
ncbi:MAG: hypothetical protein M1826_006121 [Phylliscum demangeonii]|nr:MAG: hypothetical protein M1826_006121 [Phylliscum demangeonii]